MYFYSKVIFILIIFFSYTVTYLLSRTNSTRAILKILVLNLSCLLIFSVLFQETVGNKLAQILGVGRGPDAVLYLFITLSLSINFLLAKKLVNLEDKLKKLTQKIALTEKIE
tara:strand:- start:14 stop:349 length:336 start_codon:yes stop_codon:yes gene_type:complete